MVGICKYGEIREFQILQTPVLQQQQKTILFDAHDVCQARRECLIETYSELSHLTISKLLDQQLFQKLIDI